MRLVKIRNARLRNAHDSLNRRGFGLFPFSTSMVYTDYEDTVKVKEQYCAEIANAVKEAAHGARYTRVLDFSVRVIFRCSSRSSCLTTLTIASPCH